MKVHLLFVYLATAAPLHAMQHLTKQALIPLTTAASTALQDIYEHRHAVCLGLGTVALYKTYTHYQTKQQEEEFNRRLTALEETLQGLADPSQAKQNLENLINNSEVHNLSEQELKKVLLFQLNALHNNSIACKENLTTVKERVNRLEQLQDKPHKDYFFPES